MEDWAVTTQVAALGALLGLLLGLTARLCFFCTLGAIADLYVSGDSRRFRAWLLAIALALAVTQGLHLAGLIDLHDSIYLSPDFGWLGAILGGLLFGFGMALAGTCGYGILVRMGGGDLRSLVVFLVLAIFAYMTLRGLTGLARVAFVEPTNWDLGRLGGAGLPELLGWLLGAEPEALRAPLAGLVIAGLLVFCFRTAGFRASGRNILAGLVIGLTVGAGWFVTGVVGSDDFDPQRLESLTFVRPLGETLVYLMTFSGARIDFGIGSVGGVIAGALLGSLIRGEFRLEAFDDPKEMLRHMGGGALMGIGGVTALGCTVGQGITGMATLSLAAPLTLAAIMAGAWLGLRYLEEGSLRGALRLFFQG